MLGIIRNPLRSFNCIISDGSTDCVTVSLLDDACQVSPKFLADSVTFVVLIEPIFLDKYSAVSGSEFLSIIQFPKQVKIDSVVALPYIALNCDIDCNPAINTNPYFRPFDSNSGRLFILPIRGISSMTKSTFLELFGVIDSNWFDAISIQLDIKFLKKFLSVGV